jgi:guanylate kinase
MNEAHDYISHLEEYEYVIVNNHIDETSNSVISIIKSERMKLSHLEFNITEN